MNFSTKEMIDIDNENFLITLSTAPSPSSSAINSAERKKNQTRSQPIETITPNTSSLNQPWLFLSAPCKKNKAKAQTVKFTKSALQKCTNMVDDRKIIVMMYVHLAHLTGQYPLLSMKVLTASEYCFSFSETSMQPSNLLRSSSLPSARAKFYILTLMQPSKGRSSKARRSLVYSNLVLSSAIWFSMLIKMSSSRNRFEQIH